jgi:hypothetical protein
MGVGGVMAFWLELETWVIGEGGTKGCGGKGGAGEEVWELLGFVAFVCVWCISTVVVEDACVRDCRRLRMYMVGAVG